MKISAIKWIAVVFAAFFYSSSFAQNWTLIEESFYVDKNSIKKQGDLTAFSVRYNSVGRVVGSIQRNEIWEADCKRRKLLSNRGSVEVSRSKVRNQEAIFDMVCGGWFKKLNPF